MSVRHTREDFDRVSHEHPGLSRPDFLIVGAMKSYTTSFYRALCQHPDVLRADRKEIHYFDRHYQLDPRYYLTRFPSMQRRGAEKITGEATSTYIYHPRAMERIAEAMPGVKVIVLLRPPMDRAVSHYWFQVQMGTEWRGMHRAFERAQSDELNEVFRAVRDGRADAVPHPLFTLYSYDYIRHGKYGAQLYGMEDAGIPDSNIRVYCTDGVLGKYPERVLASAWEFLGVDPGAASAPEMPRANAGGYGTDTVPEPVRDRLDDAYTPTIRRLREKGISVSIASADFESIPSPSPDVR